MRKETCDIMCRIYSIYLLSSSLINSATIDMHSVGDIGYCTRALNWLCFL